VLHQAGRGESSRSGEAPGADLPGSPTIFEAMAQIDPRLEASKQPISVIVIDSAEKPGEH
jgi:uncharacterized protein (TIGR03435 family)